MSLVIMSFDVPTEFSNHQKRESTNVKEQVDQEEDASQKMLMEKEADQWIRLATGADVVDLLMKVKH